MQKHYAIGEFSRKCGLSIDTLDIMKKKDSSTLID